MVSVASFSSVLAGLRVSKSASVAVAVSGGCDSVALTFLAKKTFRRVLGVTVDHKLRPESSCEATRAKEIVEGMVVQHRLVELEWPGGAPTSKIQELCREKRYNALSKICQEHGIDVLMTGHHLNDQIETFLYRMARASGIVGLAGIRPVNLLLLSHDEFRIPLVRPLLSFPKEALMKLCVQNGLNWVEDPSNSYPVYWRNAIRQVLSNYPEIQPGIVDIMNTCQEARTQVENQAVAALNSMATLDRTYGFVHVDHTQFRTLSSPVAIRFLQAILSLVSGEFRHFKTQKIQSVLSMLADLTQATATTLFHCIIFPFNDRSFIIARASPQRSERYLTPLKVGETILWDNRYEIKLKSLEETERGKVKVSEKLGKIRVPSADEVREKTFYVRHWMKDDDLLAVKGVRKVRANMLPHLQVRGGLPIILDESKKPVVIPHYRVVDRAAGVCCECTYKPAYSVQDIFNSMSVQL